MLALVLVGLPLEPEPKLAAELEPKLAALLLLLGLLLGLLLVVLLLLVALLLVVLPVLAVTPPSLVFFAELALLEVFFPRLFSAAFPRLLLFVEVFLLRRFVKLVVATLPALVFDEHGPPCLAARSGTRCPGLLLTRPRLRTWLRRYVES